MRYSSFVTAVLAVAALTVVSARPVEAGQAARRGRAAAGRAVPRASVRTRAVRPVVVSPRIVRVLPYRPYYYGYRPGLSIGFYAGFPLGYRYAFPYGYGYGYGYPPAAYATAVPGVAYGGVRIQGAARDGQVFVDGYYVGVVDDFDGVFQHVNLPAGPHRIEIREPGLAPIVFNVRIQPGQTITYHAEPSAP